MICPCGNTTSESSHTVTTQTKITEWLGRGHPNPIRIDKHECKSCGRWAATFYDAKTGQKIGVRG
jgi:hypothetical protein